MKERGILFSAPMVRALLAGAKTQTRRRLKLRPGQEIEHGALFTGADPFMMATSPYGVPGDRLWCRETWTSAYARGCWGTLFAADKTFVQGARRHEKGIHYNADNLPPGVKWRPSIFLPRWASRITLEVTEVRVQRLQDISEEDARAEGPLFAIDEEQTVLFPHLTPERNKGCVACRGDGGGIPALCHDSLRGKGRPFACWYATLWDAINGAGSWESNPWIWAISFARVDGATS